MTLKHFVALLIDFGNIPFFLEDHDVEEVLELADFEQVKPELLGYQTLRELVYVLESAEHLCNEKFAT